MVLPDAPYPTRDKISFLRLASRKGFSSAVLRSAPLDELLLDLETEYLIQLHADRQGNLESMARQLGIAVRALYDRFKRLGIRPQELNYRQW